jgi:hypothetical protein
LCPTSLCLSHSSGPSLLSPTHLAELENVFLAVDDLDATGGGDLTHIAGVEPAVGIEHL